MLSLPAELLAHTGRLLGEERQVDRGTVPLRHIAALAPIMNAASFSLGLPV